MAHYEKWTRSQCAQVLYHNLHMPGRNSSNENIDISKRNLNYNLAPHDMNSYEFLMQRISEIFCLNRKDVNVLSGWVVTLPRDVKPEDEDKFFKAAYDFLEKRYGKENTVDAWVHKDEAGRPHLHYDFVPVTWDKKKERYKVSAKEAVTRKDLNHFHPDLEKFVSDELGYRCSIMTGELSNRPDLTMEQFQSLKDIEKSLDLARIEYKTISKDINDLKKDLNEIRGKFDDFDTYEKMTEELLQKIEQSATKKNKKIIIPQEYWDEFKKLKSDVRASRIALDFEKDKISKLEKDLSAASEDIERYKISIKFSEEREKDLRKENEEMKPDLQRVYAALKSSPELREHFKAVERELTEKTKNIER